MEDIKGLQTRGTCHRTILTTKHTMHDIILSPKMATSLPVNILTLSAKSSEELEALVEKYKILLRSGDQTSSSLGDIAFSTNSDNQDHPHRIAVIGKSCGEIANNLDKHLFEKGVVHEPSEKLCFLFSGNGSCYHQMAKTLYDTLPHFRQEFDKWGAFLTNLNPEISIHNLLFGDDASHVEHPLNSLVTLGFVNVLISKLWNYWGIQADCTLGHSLGEYGASCSAGILGYDDILTFLFRISTNNVATLFAPGKMAVILVDKTTTEKLVSECNTLIKSEQGSPWISVAGENSQNQFLVAGCPEAIAKFLELAKNNAVRVVPLPVTAAYHSKGVDPVFDIFRNASQKLTFNKPKCEYISSMTGTVLESLPSDYWATHVRSPINFAKAARTTYEDCRARTFLEMGGQPVLSSLMAQNVEDFGGTEPIVCLASMRKGKNELETILDSLAKLYVMGYGPINWTNFYKDFDVNLIDVPLRSCSNGIHQSSTIICPLNEEQMNENGFWTLLNQATNKAEKCELLLRYVFQVMKRVLKADDSLELDADQEFRAAGIDSLLAIQMKTHLGKILGSQITLSFNDLIQCYTPGQLVQKLYFLIFSNANKESKKAEKEETKKLVEEDSVLWSHIKAVPNRPVVPLSEIKTFLVTGATGNLAPYIVLELANRQETTKIYCLVREGRDCSAQVRLENHLKEEGIWQRLRDPSIIIAVNGNIVDEKMGIEGIHYEKLAEEVDCIVNCAVTSNHLAPYKKEDLKYGGVRAVNVIGVQRMLEFAGATRTKWVYHASTFLALFGKTGVHCDRMPEDWPRDYIQELDQLPNFGYSISKLIADALVHQATMRGIPCKSFRFTKIGGDTETGKQKVMQNHFFLKFLYYIIGGVMPNLSVPLQIMSVDACAKVSVRVFFDERANPSDIYNLVAPYVVNELELVDLVEEFGPQLRVLSELSRVVEKFGEDGARQKWLEMSASGPLATVVEELDRTLGDDWWENPSSAFSNENVMEFIRSQYDQETKIVPYPEYVEHLIADGEDSLIYHWIDFYSSEDSLFYMADKGTIPLQQCWNQNQEHFLRWGKIEMLYPNLKEMIECPREALRRDILYTINNARTVFRNRYKKQ